MPAKIPESVKRNVIDEYLKGTSRDENASKNGLSEGGVTNIISEWKVGLSQPIADDIRELAVSLRKLGITAPECASGLRVAVMLQRLGVAEENFLSFISELYNQAREIGLTPGKIAQYIKELIDLSQSVPISQISDHIEQKKSEKTKLEKDIIRLRDEQAGTRHELEKALYEKEAQLADVKRFCELKSELEKVGVPVDDTSRLAKAIQGFRKFDYDVMRVVSLLANLDSACAMQAALEAQIKSSNLNLTRVKGELKYWEQLVATQSQKASKYEQLEDMGFGINRMRVLQDTIKELATENNIPENVAVESFFRDLAENYDRKLGYQSLIKKMIEELNSLTIALSYKKEVAKTLGRLSSMGYKDKDILNLATILQTHSIDEESFAIDLKKYGASKEAVEKLNQKVRELNDTKESLRAEGTRLAYNNRQIIENQARDLLALVGLNLHLTAKTCRDRISRASLPT